MFFRFPVSEWTFSDYKRSLSWVSDYRLKISGSFLNIFCFAWFWVGLGDLGTSKTPEMNRSHSYRDWKKTAPKNISRENIQSVFRLKIIIVKSRNSINVLMLLYQSSQNTCFPSFFTSKCMFLTLKIYSM